MILVAVTVSFDDIYLPLPEIAFDQVLVEIFDEEGDVDFIEILNRDADLVEAICFDSDKNEGDMGISDIFLGLVGGVVGFMIALVLFAYSRKFICSHRAKIFTEHLEEFHTRIFCICLS